MRLEAGLAVESPPPLIRQRSFCLYWLARVLSALGLQIAAAAVGWHLYDLTGSAMALGILGLVQFLPMIVLTLPAGHVADRFDRRRVVAASQAFAGAAGLLLIAGSLGDWLTPGWIYLAVAIIGSARAFLFPALAALLPGLVAPAQFPRATALTSSANQAATIIGPAMGGVLFGLGPEVPYALTAACFLGTLSIVLFLPRAGTPGGRGTSVSALFDGIAFIRRQPVVLGSIALDMFAVLLGGATALLPIYADRVLQAGPVGLGLLRAAPAVGALSMATFLAARPMQRRVGQRMLLAVATFGLATVIFGLSTNLVLSLACLVVLGAADNVSVVVRSSLVQLATPDALRGRVSAVNYLFIGTSNQLGEFESGLLASFIGVVPAVVAGGLGTIAIALLWLKLFPQLARLNRFSDAGSG